MKIQLSKVSAKDLAELIEKVASLDFVNSAEAEEVLDGIDKASKYKVKINLECLENLKSAFPWNNRILTISITETENGK